MDDNQNIKQPGSDDDGDNIANEVDEQDKVIHLSHDGPDVSDMHENHSSTHATDGSMAVGKGGEAAAHPRTKTGPYIALGWILAFASLIIFPYFIFGLAGVIMGVLATKAGSKSGVAVIAANIVMMGIGLVFGGVIASYLTRLLGI